MGIFLVRFVNDMGGGVPAPRVPVPGLGLVVRTRAGPGAVALGLGARWAAAAGRKGRAQGTGHRAIVLCHI